MCWNAKTSIISFISGTIINIGVLIYYLKHKEIVSLCVVWQWVLCMQLAEYFIWLNQKSSTNIFATKSALILNILQPLILYMVIICGLGENISIQVKILSSIIITYYISYMMIKLNEVSEYKNLTTNNCAHLSLKWWYDIPNSGYIYFIVLSFLILLLIQPLSLSVFCVVFITISVLISMKYYSCGAASMWCWFVVPFPLFLGLFYKIYYRK